MPTPDGLVAFTVRNGRAVRHTVRIVTESDSLTGFASDDIRAGDSLVVSGVVQLSAGVGYRYLQGGGPEG